MGLHPSARARLAKKLWLFIALAAVVGGIVWWKNNSSEIKKIQPSTTTEAPFTTKVSGPQPGFNKSQYSVNDPSSIWVVVNKGRVLPKDYAPTGLGAPDATLSEAASAENMQLRPDAQEAVEKLAMAAKSDGLNLMIVSGYRSFATQQAVYSGYVSSQGSDYANATSAQPGHSEHQTGLAVDLGAASRICQLEPCFGDMAEGRWLATNAFKYGFIIRYQKNKNNLTGYNYEPWHIRYIGTDLATNLNNTGQTLEQFFGLPADPDYPVQNYQLKIDN